MKKIFFLIFFIFYKKNIISSEYITLFKYKFTNFIGNQVSHFLGQKITNLGKNIEGKNYKYAFHEPKYDDDVTETNKNKINYILKNYVNVYNLIVEKKEKEKINRAIIKILNDAKNKAISFDQKSLEQKKMPASKLELKKINEYGEDINHLINFWIDQEIYDEKSKSNLFEEEKSNNIFTKNIVTLFLDNYDYIYAILMKYYFNNILKKLLIEEKNISFEFDFDGDMFFKIMQRDILLSENNILSYIKNNIPIENDFAKIKSYKNENNINKYEKEIKENEKEEQLLAEKINKIQEKKNESMDLYKKEIEEHERNFDTSFLDEQIANIKKKEIALHEELKEIEKNKQNNTGWFAQIKYAINLPDHQVKKEINKLEKKIKEIEELKKERIEQKEREYNLFMPKENVIHINNNNKEIEEIKNQIIINRNFKEKLLKEFKQENNEQNNISNIIGHIVAIEGLINKNNSIFIYQINNKKQIQIDDINEEVNEKIKLIEDNIKNINSELFKKDIITLIEKIKIYIKITNNENLRYIVYQLDNKNIKEIFFKIIMNIKESELKKIGVDISLIKENIKKIKDQIKNIIYYIYSRSSFISLFIILHGKSIKEIKNETLKEKELLQSQEMFFIKIKNIILKFLNNKIGSFY